MPVLSTYMRCSTEHMSFQFCNHKIRYDNGKTTKRMKCWSQENEALLLFPFINIKVYKSEACSIMLSYIVAHIVQVLTKGFIVI